MTEQRTTSTVPIAHRYEHDRERDWLPLERFAELSSQSAAELDADDFMWMAAAEFADGRVVHSYKPIDTRRYLHLDARGHCYRYVPAAEGGRYLPWPDPGRAIRHSLDQGMTP